MKADGIRLDAGARAAPKLSLPRSTFEVPTTVGARTRRVRSHIRWPVESRPTSSRRRVCGTLRAFCPASVSVARITPLRTRRSALRRSMACKLAGEEVHSSACPAVTPHRLPISNNTARAQRPPDLDSGQKLALLNYWHASQSPPLRMASMLQASFCSSVKAGLGAFGVPVMPRISFTTSEVAFSMLEALRVRR